MFEVEPPEGYDYWKRKEFREDTITFVGFSFLAVLIGSLPLVAMLRDRRRPPFSSRRRTEIAMAVLILILGILPATLLITTDYGPGFHYTHLAPLFLTVGAIYACYLSVRRIRSLPTTVA